MSQRLETARRVAQRLLAASLNDTHGVMGFDGFVDQIIEVVDKRRSPVAYDRLTTIAQFGAKISAAAGKSSNFELVVKHRKLGGNGPIMANALACLGMRITYIGTVGVAGNDAAIDPVFDDFATRATLLPLAPPAHTNALEFTDGKVMLGDLAPLSQVTWQRLLDVVGIERLRALFEPATFLGLVNWTMLPHLTSLWVNVAETIFPTLSKKPRRMFVDLADPEKREPADLKAALAVLTAISHPTNGVAVTLGLNLSEGLQVARLLGIHADEVEVLDLAVQIRAKLALDTVVIHPRTGAAAATADDSAEFAGPFVHNPVISTGAGDHFNTGFSVGQLLKLSLEESLCLGTATSGYYVRHAASPNAAQLSEFLENLPDPQLA